MDQRTVPKKQRLRLVGFFPESEGLLKDPERASGEVYCHLEFEVGKGSERDTEVFSVTVATPNALLENIAPERWALADHGTIVVRDFDPHRIRAHIEEILARCEAPTLHDAIPRLQRYFRSERE
jgi:hypothetical protein